MKKFTENIAARVRNSYHVRVSKSDNCITLQWGKSMSQIGDGYIYILSWTYKDNQLVWIERDQDYNVVTNTGMTCICDDINLEGDGLFVTIETLEREKSEITAMAAEIYDAQKSRLKSKDVVIDMENAIPGKFFAELEVLKPAEVGIGYHGTYKLKNATIKEVYSHFYAVGPGSSKVSRVRVVSSGN